MPCPMNTAKSAAAFNAFTLSGFPTTAFSEVFDEDLDVGTVTRIANLIFGERHLLQLANPCPVFCI